MAYDTRHIHGRAARLLGLSLLVVNTGCGDGTEPSRIPADIFVVSGAGQQGTVGAALPEPLLVRVVDADGNGIAGVGVSFQVVSGGGSVPALTRISDAAGLAQTQWTLGTSAVEPQQLEARVFRTGMAAPLVEMIEAVAAPGAAARLSLVQAPPSSARSGIRLSPAPTVQLVDTHGNAVATAGVPVSVAINAGGGALGGTTPQATNASGMAVFDDLSLSGTVGERRLTFSAPGLQSATSENIQLNAGDPATIVKTSGDAQSDTIGASLQRPVVRVLDASGNPVPNAAVRFRPVDGLSAVTGSEQVTNAAGEASPSSWVLGDRTGSAHVVVEVPGIPNIDFAATVLPGRPATIQTAGGDSQEAVIGHTVHRPPVARVVDRMGNAAGSGFLVTFEIASGGGAISGSSSITAGSGEAVGPWWTLGSQPGPNTLVARISGSSTVFRATAFPPFAAIDVAPGMNRSCALDRSGAAYCWTPTDSVLRAVPGGFTFSSLARGNAADHACALTAAGKAYCWGEGAAGRLGDGTTTSKTTPVPVSGNLTFTHIAVSERSTCGLTADGLVYCWGDNFSGGLGVAAFPWPAYSTTPTQVTGSRTYFRIAGGQRHVCALSAADSTAYCWGSTSYQQAGADPHGGNATLCPARWPGHCVMEPRQVPTARAYADVAAGAFHSCALTAAGSTFCWGHQTGYGGTRDTSAATQVLTTQTTTMLAAGHHVTCGLSTAGQLRCFAENLYGEAGNASSGVTNGFVPVSGGLSFTRVAAGGNRVCGTATDGVLHCWGRAPTGDATMVNRATPTVVIGR